MEQKTILIVDDEKETLNALATALEPEGYTILKAPNGRKCLELLKKNTVDLILLDFFMPGMSGREILEKIRSDPQFKKTKVAFMTVASFSQAGQKQIEAMGVIDYIKKPFQNKDLIKRVRQLLQQKG